LEDAQSVRVRLAKLGENIDATSKRILILGGKKNTQEELQETQEREVRLYQMVRTSAMIFLKEELLTLQPLPSVEEYAALQEERQKKIEARIAYERQLEEQREKPKEQRKRDTWNSDNNPPIKTNQVLSINKLR
jgi:rabenosyn-5